MNQVIIEALEGRDTLYSPDFEHDSCGVGFIASIHGKRSNQVLRYGIDSLCHLAHRGAVDADAKTGDGAGVVTQIPYKVLAPEVKRLGHELFQESDLGVGFVFLPHDNAYAQARAKAITEEVIAKREPLPLRLARGADQFPRAGRESRRPPCRASSRSSWAAPGA